MSEEQLTLASIKKAEEITINNKVYYRIWAYFRESHTTLQTIEKKPDHYSPDDLVGREIGAYIYSKPKTLRGFSSHFFLAGLLSDDKEHIYSLDMNPKDTF